MHSGIYNSLVIPSSFHNLGISNKTNFWYPQTIHAEAEEGYREACSCLLCPRWGGRRVQRSLLLSPVPTLRWKKGTEKLAPVSCAHVEAEEGYREACSCLLCPRWGERRGTGGTCPVYGSPTLRAMHSIHKCVAKDAPHLFHWRLSPYKVKNKNIVLWASSQIAVFVLTLHGS